MIKNGGQLFLMLLGKLAERKARRLFKNEKASRPEFFKHIVSLQPRLAKSR